MVLSFIQSDIWGENSLTVVYADVLLLINFSMDFISLYIVAKLMKLKLNFPRLILSSSVGAIYSLCDFLVNWPSPILAIFTNFCFSAVMCYIAFGNLKIHIFLISGVFYGICFLLGGAITAIYSIAGEKWNIINEAGYIYTDISLLEVLGLTIIAVIFVKFITERMKRRCINRNAELSVTIKGVTSTFDAFVDSGCFVKEPITNKEVVFLKKECFKTFFENETEITPQLHTKAGLRICAVPVTTLTGKDVLFGIYPDKILCDGIMVDAVIVFADALSLKFNGSKALISNNLL